MWGVDLCSAGKSEVESGPFGSRLNHFLVAS